MDEPTTRKRCSRCGKKKPAGEFGWHRKERRQRDAYCLPCRSEYGKAHYRANRQRYIDKAAQRRKVVVTERMRYLVGYFKDHPCTDCGELDPVVLEFDHIGAKTFDIGKALHERSWEAILEEIECCQVVCANCHRRRTARRRGAIRVALVEGN
jgi:hypothetical protein